MAHQGGYGGTITLGVAADAEFGPTSTEIALQRWDVVAETDTFGAYAKSDAFETTFNTGTRWRATIEALMETGAAATKLDIRKAATAAKAMTAVKFHAQSGAGTDNYLTGSGFVTSVDFDDPLDGPVLATFEMEGDGGLTFTSDIAA